MRNGFTFLFLLFGAVMFVLGIVQLIKGKVSEAIPLGVMALIGFGLAAGTWYFIGRHRQKMAEEDRQIAAAPKPPKVVMPAPAGPIEMRRTWASVGKTVMWAVGFLLTGVLLLWNPEALWTRWLAYPVAVIALLLAPGVAYIAVSEKKERIVADANGIRFGESLTAVRVAWRDVATATIVEVRPDFRSKQIGVLDRYLLLESKDGEELMRVKELAPPEEYRRFLNAIPAWTGREVQEKIIRR